MSKDDDNKVGRNHPPVDKQFGKGQPGNRCGRPKGTPNAKTIVTKFAREKHTVIENNRPVRRSTIELVVQALKNKAMEGNVKANTELDQLNEFLNPNPENFGCLVVPKGLPLEEWIRQEEIFSSQRPEPSARSEIDI